MADTKDHTIIEYENMIEDLMKENENLRKKVSELEDENKLLKYTDYSFKEAVLPEDKKETKKPAKLPKKSKKKEKPAAKPAAKPAPELTFSTDSTAPSLPKHSIVEGTSRRECPICRNTINATIHEIIDRTNIILDYPRIYGKRYRCGKCGQEWRIPTTLE